MMKFGANVTQTALKGLNLAQAGNYDHVLNLKYTCRALPSCSLMQSSVVTLSGIKSVYTSFVDHFDLKDFLLQ